MHLLAFALYARASVLCFLRGAHANYAKTERMADLIESQFCSDDCTEGSEELCEIVIVNDGCWVQVGHVEVQLAIRCLAHRLLHAATSVLKKALEQEAHHAVVLRLRDVAHQTRDRIDGSGLGTIANELPGAWISKLRRGRRGCESKLLLHGDLIAEEG